jgi:hypothetical protein
VENFSSVLSGIEVGINIPFQENHEIRSCIDRIAHSPAFWRILVGNGKSGRSPEDTVKASKDRALLIQAQIQPVEGAQNVHKPYFHRIGQFGVSSLHRPNRSRGLGHIGCRL